MDASLDLSRWTELPRGINYRRWTIVATGLKQLFRLRYFKILFTIAWTGGALLALLGFAFSQAIASGGWLETFAVYFGPRAQAIVSALGGVILLYPDVCIGGWFTLIFWLHSFLGLGLGLLALTAMVPMLITRDRASNALIVYLARPLTSFDYLLGKLGIIVGVLALLWTGPLLFGWVLSVAFAPDWDFVTYSFAPLLHALCYHAIGLVALAAVALGVSAATRSSRATIILWLGLWLVLGAVAAPPRAPDWIKRASFSHNLREIRQGIFRVDNALITASESLPLTNQKFAASLGNAGRRAEASDFDGALLSLGVFVAISSFVFLRRLKPE